MHRLFIFCSGTVNWAFYLCLLIGFVLVPALKMLGGEAARETANPWYYLFFLNNFDYIQKWPLLPDALILIVLWSVAVEEQFYVAWPLLMKWLPVKRLPLFFVLVIGGTLLFRSFYTGASDQDYAVRQFHTLAVIGDMALGGLLAYLTLYNPRFFNGISSLPKAGVAAIYAAALVILLFREELFALPVALVLERLVIGLVFGLVILEQNFCRHSFFKCARWKNLSRAGIYTYGLYCLHFFVISLVQKLAEKLHFPTTASSTAALAALALAATLGIAFLSFWYFERPFLSLKERFSRITKD